MTEAEKIIDKVIPKKKYYEMGNITANSPNKMYKKYLMGFKQKYGDTKKPLRFADYLSWARHKGIIEKRFTAEGDAPPPSAPAKDVVIKKTGTTKGKWIAGILLFTGLTGIIYAIIKSK